MADDLHPAFKNYRKRPVVVRAARMHGPFLVHTLEGVMEGAAGDYLIVGVEGEQYPCKASIFEATHEEVTDGKRQREDGRD